MCCMEQSCLLPPNVGYVILTVLLFPDAKRKLEISDGFLKRKLSDSKG